MTWWQRLLCNTLDWHRPVSVKLFDGCSWKSKCVRCKRHILRDSQGNWFGLRSVDLDKYREAQRQVKSRSQTAWPRKRLWDEGNPLIRH